MIESVVTMGVVSNELMGYLGVESTWCWRLVGYA
jgi:hypothetical protein